MTEISRDLNDYGFQTEVRVRLSETDAVGIAFFGSFAIWFDVGRMDYLANLGLLRQDGPVPDLIPGAVVRQEANFHSPAHYNEVLTLNVRVAALGTTSYTFHFFMTNKRSRTPVATGLLTLVWLGDAFRPIPIPADFRAELEAFEGSRLGAAG